VLTNHSDVPLMWVALKGYRGGREVLTGRPRGKRSLPLVQAHGEYSTQIGTGTNSPTNPEAPDAWQPMERFGVTSLMGQDGPVEGDVAAADSERRFNEGIAADLRTLLAVLRGARDGSAAALKAQLPVGADFMPETKADKDDIVADVEALERTQRSRTGQE